MICSLMDSYPRLHIRKLLENVEVIVKYLELYSTGIMKLIYQETRNKCVSIRYERNHKKFVDQFLEIFRNESNNCECPVPCEITKYQVQLSYAQTPAKHFSEVLAKRKHVRKDVMRHYLR